MKAPPILPPLSRTLREWGIVVPHVLAYDAANNYMLLEDFGDRPILQ